MKIEWEPWWRTAAVRQYPDIQQAQKKGVLDVGPFLQKEEDAQTAGNSNDSETSFNSHSIQVRHYYINDNTSLVVLDHFQDILVSTKKSRSKYETLVAAIRTVSNISFLVITISASQNKWMPKKELVSTSRTWKCRIDSQIIRFKCDCRKPACTESAGDLHLPEA